MLIELRIRNFAVLEDLTVPLEPGLNVITGETGAGKSIVVDALDILLGGRSSSDAVRSGESRAVIEGVVDVRGLTEVEERLEALGLEADEDHVVLRREVQSGGRSRGWINGSPTTATVLRDLGSHLVDIHGQHEHQRLLRVDFQQDVLDSFAGARGVAANVSEIFRRAAELKSRLADLEDRRRELESRADFIRFQLGEIEGAGLDPGEEDELDLEIGRLGNADLLAREGAAIHHRLYGDDESIADGLAEALAKLRRLAESDPSLAPRAAALEEAYHRVTDVGVDLGDYASNIDHDPARLEALQERRALLQGLKRKYGATLADVIEAGDALRRELDELDAAELDADTLAAELSRTEEAWRAAAQELSDRRREAALRLAARTEALFPDLGLEGGRFQVQFEDVHPLSARGLERTQFMASMNPGFPPGPLSRIASGGELSRVMLALKAVLAGLDDLPTLVFDEIDAGVGGVVASRVADNLVSVAADRQVLVVTHLAQIACRASNHLVVEKATGADTTTTTLRQLTPEARVPEIARMLGGDPESPTSLEHARSLLGRADPELERAG